MTCLISFEKGRQPVIAALGAATPVGRSAAAAAAAVRAGISGFSQHAFMVDSEGEPLRIAQCPWLTSEPSITNHISCCLDEAIRQALMPLAARGGNRPSVTILVNLPAPRPGVPTTLADEVSAGLRASFPGEFGELRLAQLGHAGGIVAMQSALHILAQRPATACVVAGGDSYLDLDALEWLEEVDRLHGAGKRNNAWGFVPGEGAGALLMVSGETAERAGIQPLGQIRNVGIAREANLIGTETVCLGEGLTLAIREATGGFDEKLALTDVYCDMNGEPYRADEYAFAVTRLRERFIAASDFRAPADCWGDVGAASTILSIALACIAGSKGYANGPRALIWGSSDAGERAAVTIQTMDGRD